MKITDFNFELPDELIARYPLPHRRASRLLCLDGKTGITTHNQFEHILQLIEPGDLMVFNDTRVIPARIYGQKKTGGQVEVLVERILDNHRILAQVRVSKPPQIGDHLLFANDIQLEVIARDNQFYELRYNHIDRTVLEVIESIGQIPLPPYMHRDPDEQDVERYQTVYATHKGSVAAPTAGLHFDQALLQDLQAKGVEMGYLTLHIGAGTFQPVRVDEIHEHKMHAEYLEVSPVLCEQIEQTRARGKRVIAIGTTSLRALETACQSGKLEPYRGETNIFITPGYTFHAADVLVTNMHLPKSTLLILLCAFAGYDNVMRAYREAVQSQYRFYSYGDAMWVTRHK